MMFRISISVIFPQMRKACRSLFVAMLLAGAALAAGPAHACRVPSSATPILHETLEPDAEGDFAAKVEIERSDVEGGDRHITARILQVLRGAYAGATVRLGPGMVITSCDAYPQVGEIGVLVGNVISANEDELVLQPTRAPSERELLREEEQPGQTE